MPGRPHAGHQDSGRVALDGIRHSFERSTSSFRTSASPPFGMTSFRITQEGTKIVITGEGGSGEGAGFPAPTTEQNEAAEFSRTVTLDVPDAERSNLSPFSAFLNRSKPFVLVTQAQINSSTAALEQFQVCPSPPSRFLAASDLEALERRFQVLVSEAAGSICAQFLEGLLLPVQIPPSLLLSKYPD